MAITFIFPTQVLQPGEEITFLLETHNFGANQEDLRKAISDTKLVEVATIDYSFRSLINPKNVFDVRARILRTVTAGQLKADIEASVNLLAFSFGTVVSEIGYEKLTFSDIVTVPATTSLTFISIAILALVGLVVFVRVS